MRKLSERASRWVNALIITVTALCSTTMVSSTAHAQASLIRGLGGPADFGTNEVPYNDDGSSMEIDVSRAFPYGLRFFGMTFRSLYVNNNGNITRPGRFPSRASA